MTKIIIFGNGEMASLSKYYFNSISKKIDFFCVDDDFIKESKFENTPILPFSELKNKDKNESKLFVALSYSQQNKLRENKFNEIIMNGLRTSKGINIEKLNRITNSINVDKKIQKWPQLVIQDKYLRLKDNDFMLLDEITADLFIA